MFLDHATTIQTIARYTPNLSRSVRCREAVTVWLREAVQSDERNTSCAW